MIVNNNNNNNMKYVLIVLVLLSCQLYSQNNNFYEDLNNSGLKIYSQINEDPVLISHGNILSENIMPNYSSGLQFMQAPGLFNSENELYTYLTSNSDFYFSNHSEVGSYYNKNSTHSSQREQYYNNGVEIYNESLSYTSDSDASESDIWDLISNVRYQLVFRETYIKDNNYEFLLLTTINVFKADIDVNSNSDIAAAVNYFLRNSSEEEIEKFKKSAASYSMVKEDGIWKACSADAVFEYLNEMGHLLLITEKINSNNFYDVLSNVEGGLRQYTQAN